MRTTAVPFVVLLLLCSACSNCSKNVTPTPPPSAQEVLAQAAKAVEAISIATNDATKAVLQAMPEATPEREQILNIIKKIVLADQHAKNILVVLESQTLDNPAQIAKAVVPILREIRDAINNGLLGIKNIDARKQAQVWLDAIAIAVTSIQGVLEVYYGPA